MFTSIGCQNSPTPEECPVLVLLLLLAHHFLRILEQPVLMLELFLLGVDFCFSPSTAARISASSLSTSEVRKSRPAEEQTRHCRGDQLCSHRPHRVLPETTLLPPLHLRPDAPPEYREPLGASERSRSGGGTRRM